jgi:hypothetical protein
MENKTNDWKVKVVYNKAKAVDVDEQSDFIAEIIHDFNHVKKISPLVKSITITRNG